MATTVLDRLVTVLGWTYDPTGLRQFEQGIAKAQNKMRSLGKVMTRGGLALTGAFAGATLESATFEKSILKMRALVGITEEEAARYEAAILAISDTTNIGAAQLGDAAYFLSSAGFGGDSLIDLLDKTAKAAKSGLGEVDALAELMVGIMNTWPDLAPEVAFDQLIATVRTGVLDPENLARPISMVLPFAGELDIEFSDIAGAMSALSTKGIQASRGAEALRGILAKILKPTEAGKKALAEMGVEMDTVRDTFRDSGIIAGLNMVRDALGGDTELLAKVFEDVQALSGVLALSGENASNSVAIIDAVASATGDLESAFEIMATGQSEAFSGLINNLRMSALEMGNRLAPAFKRFMEIGERLIDWYDDLNPRVKEWISYIVAMGPVLLVAGFAMKYLAAALGVYAGLVKGVVLLTGKLKWALVALGKTSVGTAVGLKVLAAAQWLVNTAVLGFPIIGWIAALVAAGVAIYIFRDQIVDFLKTAWTWTERVLGWIVGAVAHMVDIAIGPFVAAWARFGDAIIAPFRAAWHWIREWWATVTGWLSGINLFEVGRQIIGTLVDGVRSVVGGVIGTVTAPFHAAWEWLANLDFFEVGRQIIGTLVDGVRSVVGGVIGTVTAPFHAAWEWLANLDFFEVGRQIILTLVDGVKSAAGGVIDTVKGVVGKVRDLLPFSDAKKGPLHDLTSSGRGFIDTLTAGVRREAPRFEQTIMGMLGGSAMTAGLRVAAGGVIDTVKGVVGKVRDLLPFSDAKKGPLHDLTSSGRGFIDTLTAGVRREAPRFEQTIMGMLGGSAMTAGLRVAAGGVIDTVKGVVGKVRDFSQRFSDAKKGPPHDPNRRGDAFMMPFAAGMEHQLPRLEAVMRIAEPLPVGPAPVPAPVAATHGGAPSFEMRIDRIEVTAAGGDVDDIAANIGDALRRESRAIVEEFDTRVRA